MAPSGLQQPERRGGCRGQKSAKPAQACPARAGGAGSVVAAGAKAFIAVQGHTRPHIANLWPPPNVTLLALGTQVDPHFNGQSPILQSGGVGPLRICYTQRSRMWAGLGVEPQLAMGKASQCLSSSGTLVLASFVKGVMSLNLRKCLCTHSWRSSCKVQCGHIGGGL